MAGPKGKKPTGGNKDSKKNSDGPKVHHAPVQTDPRFAHVHRDPRFMRPNKKDNKVTVDSRFSSMLKSKDFSSAPKVDRYGRKLQSQGSDKQMQKFYQLQKGEAGSDAEDDDEEEEQDSEEDDDDEEADDDDDQELDISASESDEEEGGVYDPMRGRGVIDGSSSSEDESDIDEEVAAELDREALAAGEDDDEEEEEEDDIPRGDETHRFACVNLDWDHVKSVDLFKVFSGFKPETGALRSVKIFVSEFGKERLEREEREGPPAEIFTKPGSKKRNNADSDDDEDDEEITAETLMKEQAEDGEDDYDTEALRKYQLDRLKYYYAVVDCDSVETAKAITEACDGAEYESSANFFDLRYIPDEMEFEEEDPRDEAFGAPENYKPNDFTTQVFQHSNVKLTWDEDDADRIKVTRQNFSKQDLDDMDFKAYLASSDEEDSEDDDDIEAARRKYRALLSGGGKDSDDDEENSDKDQEMEITFAPGLSEAAAEMLEEKRKAKEAVVEETSIDAYKRKEKERKARRKAARAAKVAGSGSDDDSDDDEAMQGGEALFSDDEDDRLLNDSYFAEEFAGMAPAAGKKGDDKKKNKDKKKKRTKEERLEDNRKKAELELLMEDNRDSNQHFNMKEIQKAEKKSNLKNKKKGGNKKDDGEDLQDDFQIDVKDPRFSALHDSHLFALDPTNPHFKKTKAMTQLLQERQRISASKGEQIEEDTGRQNKQKQQQQPGNKNKNKINNSNNTKKAPTGPFQDPSLSLLVDTVKRKSAMATEDSRDGKRSKKSK